MAVGLNEQPPVVSVQSHVEPKQDLEDRGLRCSSADYYTDFQLTSSFPGTPSGMR